MYREHYVDAIALEIPEPAIEILPSMGQRNGRGAINAERESNELCDNRL